MTHAELRTRLAGYADGTLPEAEAEAIRAHLSGGCDECLRIVFMRPMGLPRPTPGQSRVPWGQIAAVLAACGAGLAVGAVLMARSAVRALPAASRDDGLARELAALRASHEVEVRRLDAAVGRLQERALGETSADRGGSAPTDGPATTPGWLSELLSSEGIRVVSLRASEVAPGASGYALWSPARGIVVVSAEGLPTATRGTYRIRVELSDHATVWVGDLEQEPSAALTVTVALPDGPGRRVRAIDLYREPPGSPALSARLLR